MKRIQQHRILFAAIFLLLTAFIWDYYSQNNKDLTKYVNQIENYISNNEKAIIDLYDNKDLLQRLINNKGYEDKDWKAIEALGKEQYSIFIYKEKELLFWSTNIVKPVIEEISANATRKYKLVKFNNSRYELITETFLLDKEKYIFVGLIPIYYQYNIENEHIDDHFALTQSIPNSVRLSEHETDFVVRNKQKEKLFYLESKTVSISNITLKFLLFFYGLGFLLLYVAINRMTLQLTKQHSPFFGFLFLVSAFFIIRYLSLNLPFNTVFDSLPLFQSKKFIVSTLSGSIIGLLLNSILVLWVALFFFIQVTFPKTNYAFLKSRNTVTYGSYALIFVGFWWTNNVIRDLVLKSKIALDFDNIFNLDISSFLGLLSISFLVLSLFLFSYKVAENARKKTIANAHKKKVAIIAFSVTFLLAMIGSIPWNIVFLVGFTIIYIGLMEIFIRQQRTTLQWIGGWLFLYSVFLVTLILYFNHRSEQDNRIEFAERLISKRDEEAEKQFSNLVKEILTESVITNMANPIIPRYVIEDAIKDVNKQNSYLLENYNLNVHFFNRIGRGRKGEKADYSEIKTMLDASDTTLNKNLYFWSNEKNEEYAYIAELEIKDKNRNIGWIILRYLPKNVNNLNPYPELFTDRSLLNNQGFNYDFAIYKKGRKSKSKGGEYSNKLTFAAPEVSQKYYFTTKGNRTYLVYRADNEQIAIVGKDKKESLKPVSLFSYIFCFLSILILFIAIVGKLTSAYKYLPVGFQPQPSLRNRIQTSVLAVIVLTFLTIGLVTFYYFRSNADEYHSSRLERKSRGVLASTAYWMQINAQDSAYVLDIEALSKIHKLDINFFSANGSLFISSQPEIYKKGLIASQMPPLPYFSMTQKGLDAFADREQIGSLSYRVAYRVVKNAKGELVGFLGMPYYSEKSDFNADIANFIGTLLNVYVALLIIAFIAAFITANTIANPLSKLTQKLKAVKLGQKNDALLWETKDEIGELIDEYNRMLVALERSANKLATSEREGAWREMAKQVAHEIKNPLTPMKLSIQYLTHAYDSRPEAIGPMLQRVAATLIEQIDSLARIATEFSNFAKMPQAENEYLVVNDLINNVYNLFSRNDDVDMSLEMTDQQLTVFADKEQLMRVFNNIIKNAIQAIPDDKRGVISVALSIEHKDSIVLRVKDNGCGIPEDKKNSVFVPNFTTKNSGTGLGLAISRKIVEHAGGSIRFISVEDVGTTFIVELPLKVPQGDEYYEMKDAPVHTLSDEEAYEVEKELDAEIEKDQAAANKAAIIIPNEKTIAEKNTAIEEETQKETKLIPVEEPDYYKNVSLIDEDEEDENEEEHNEITPVEEPDYYKNVSLIDEDEEDENEEEHNEITPVEERDYYKNVSLIDEDDEDENEEEHNEITPVEEPDYYKNVSLIDEDEEDENEVMSAEELDAYNDGSLIDDDDEDEIMREARGYYKTVGLIDEDEEITSDEERDYYEEVRLIDEGGEITSEEQEYYEYEDYEGSLIDEDEDEDDED